MSTAAAIRLLVAVALAIVVLALLGVAAPHDPDPAESWTLYPSYWSGH